MPKKGKSKSLYQKKGGKKGDIIETSAAKRRAQTPEARRTRKCRNIQTCVDSILSSIDLMTSQEENNLVMKKVLEDPNARNAVLASGYIKKRC